MQRPDVNVASIDTRRRERRPPRHARCMQELANHVVGSNIRRRLRLLLLGNCFVGGLLGNGFVGAATSGNMSNSNHETSKHKE